MPLAEDIDALDPVYGETPLGMAAMDESTSAYAMVKPLLARYGADPNVTDRRGFTALHYAARASNYAVAELLLGFGADVDAENPLHEDKRTTPLWMAYQKNRTRLADFLKQRGARERAGEIAARRGDVGGRGQGCGTSAQAARGPGSGARAAQALRRDGWGYRKDAPAPGANGRTGSMAGNEGSGVSSHAEDRGAGGGWINKPLCAGDVRKPSPDSSLAAD